MKAKRVKRGNVKKERVSFALPKKVVASLRRYATKRGKTLGGLLGDIVLASVNAPNEMPRYLGADVAFLRQATPRELRVVDDVGMPPMTRERLREVAKFIDKLRMGE